MSKVQLNSVVVLYNLVKGGNMPSKSVYLIDLYKVPTTFLNKNSS